MTCSKVANRKSKYANLHWQEPSNRDVPDGCSRASRTELQATPVRSTDPENCNGKRTTISSILRKPSMNSTPAPPLNAADAPKDLAVGRVHIDNALSLLIWLIVRSVHPAIRTPESNA